MSRTPHTFLATLALWAGSLLAGCTSLATPVDLTPHFDGTYQLPYASSGDALYYRFQADGTVLTLRTSAPGETAREALRTGGQEGLQVLAGQWQVENSALRIRVDAANPPYTARFDIDEYGDVRLTGLPRTLDFVPDDSAPVAAVPEATDPGTPDTR